MPRTSRYSRDTNTQSLVCVNRPVLINYTILEDETLPIQLGSVNKQPSSCTPKICEVENECVCKYIPKLTCHGHISQTTPFFLVSWFLFYLYNFCHHLVHSF